MISCAEDVPLDPTQNNLIQDEELKYPAKQLIKHHPNIHRPVDYPGEQMITITGTLEDWVIKDVMANRKNESKKANKVFKMK